MPRLELFNPQITNCVKTLGRHQNYPGASHAIIKLDILLTIL